jgi:hypothetical protein
MMKYRFYMFLGLLLFAFTASQAAAQMQNPQTQNPEMVCEGDVYALCGDAIPDQVRITACLRANWKQVSHGCREFMAHYGRHQHNSRDDWKEQPDFSRER